MTRQVTNLDQLLDVIEKAAENHEQVSLKQIMEQFGSRSLGPLLLVAGLITLAPIIGDIPGVPTIMAVLVLLVAVQLLMRRDEPWLPNWLLKRSVSREKIRKLVGWSRKPAKFVDRLIRPRLTWLVVGAGRFFIALMCIAIALMMPPMEVVPFSANGAGLALSAFGLALISRDGVLALIAVAVVALVFGLVIYKLI